ncbi:MAG: HEPN domain-containing protein [Brevinematia bacterium]
MIDEYVKKWLKKAMEDYKTALHEFNLPPREEVVTSSVCFHCQQAVEKLLKAYLTAKKIDFGKIHALEFLVKLCAEEDEDFNNIDVGDLSSYAVDVRYPDDFYIPSIKEAEKALSIVKEIKTFIFKKLNIDENSVFLRQEGL